MTEDRLSCEEVIERLFEYLDRELDAGLVNEIERHLERCRDCCSRAEFERKLRAKVAETGTARAPERLRRRVRKLIDEF